MAQVETMKSKTKQDRRKPMPFSRSKGLLRQLNRQKKSLLSLAGIGASGFTDISQDHDKYLHEKP